MDKYIGIDIHQDSCHATVQDEDGRTVKQGEFTNSPSGFDDFFGGIDKATVAIEASDQMHGNPYTTTFSRMDSA